MPAVLLGVLLTAILIGIGTYAAGKYPGWQDRRDFDALCRGYLDHAEVSEFFGTRSLVPLDTRLEDTALEDRCRLNSSDGLAAQLIVELGWADKMGRNTWILHDPAFRMYEPLPDDGVGFVTVDKDQRHVEALAFIECTSTERHVMVQVSGEMNWGEQGVLGVREARTLGRIAVGAAQQMGWEEGCKPRSGPHIDDQNFPVLNGEGAFGRGVWADPSQAAGTCSSVKKEVSSLRVLRIEAIQESAAGRSPIESCLLVTEEGAEYWLTSWFGPYATEVVIGRGTTSIMRLMDHGVAEEHKSVMRAWGAGTCAMPFETGRFALRAGTSNTAEMTYTEAELEAQTKLLNVFVAESAERHGCREVTLP